MIRDSQDIFTIGYDMGYARACKDWEEKIDAVKAEIMNLEMEDCCDLL